MRKNTSRGSMLCRLLALARVLLLLCLPFFAACGGGDEPFVAYEGSTLKVAGVAYQRPDYAQIQVDYVAGEVVVEVKPGQQATFDALRTQLGLQVTRSLGSNSFGSDFEIAVPTGWELQWIAALRDQASVASASLDVVLHASGVEAP
jgi:hypothetical protein